MMNFVKLNFLGDKVGGARQALGLHAEVQQCSAGLEEEHHTTELLAELASFSRGTLCLLERSPDI